MYMYMKLELRHRYFQQAIRQTFSKIEARFMQEGIAVGRTFAALKNYQVDGNKEMIAIGLMNIVGSSTSCYVTTGLISS